MIVRRSNADLLPSALRRVFVLLLTNHQSQAAGRRPGAVAGGENHHLPVVQRVLTSRNERR
jgi:hypothetical protein